MLSFKDDDFPSLPSPALPNHCSVSNNVVNPSSNIMKPVHTKKFDVCCRSITSNVCNTVTCVRNVNIGYNRSTLASHNHHFNVSVQHVSVLSCGRPRHDSCFHNCANGVKSCETVRDLSVHEDVTADFCSNITIEPIKSVLPRKSVHKSVSSKCSIRASVSTSSVKSNVSFSVSRTSTCLDQSSPVFNIQQYCNLFCPGSFNIRIPLQNVLTQMMFLIFLLSFLPFSMYYKFSAVNMNIFINSFLVIVLMLIKLNCLRKFFVLHILRNGTFLHLIVKTYIIFQLSTTILLLYTSEISVFIDSLCIFAMLDIIILNFSTSKVKKKLL